VSLAVAGSAEICDPLLIGTFRTPERSETLSDMGHVGVRILPDPGRV
jgi:hypothetical protein